MPRRRLLRSLFRSSLRPSSRRSRARRRPSPVAEAAPPAQEAPKKASWLSRLKQGLSRTGQSIGGLFVGVKVDENLFEELESALIMADAGLEATETLLTALRAREKERIEDPAKVRPRCASCWPTICARWSVPSISRAPSRWW